MNARTIARSSAVRQVALVAVSIWVLGVSVIGLTDFTGNVPPADRAVAHSAGVVRAAPGSAQPFTPGDQIGLIP